MLLIKLNIYNNLRLKLNKHMYSRYTEFNSLDLCSMPEMSYPEGTYNDLVKGPAGQTSDGV